MNNHTSIFVDLQIWYTTKTVYTSGKITDDKGLYMDGLKHAYDCCQKRLSDNNDIDFIVLIPDNGEPTIVTRIQ